jgi:CRISPR-associated protein Csd2
MAKNIYCNPTVRHDFVLLFDVVDGNPNGDPDAGNLPRLDPETMHGLVTDVCLKRKVRDWVYVIREGKAPYDIYVKHRTYLVDAKKRAYEAVGGKKGDDKKADDARAWLCRNCYDVRVFGAVLVGKKGEGYNCGQVRGPIQLGFARSVSPIAPLDLSITRVALENPGEKPREDEDEKAATGTMGRKAIVPYGLYRCHGFFTPSFAEKTGTSQEDLDLFWQGLQRMWDIDHSAARAQMACRGLYLFTHDSKLGNAPSHVLFDHIMVEQHEEIDVPRKFADYTVTVRAEQLPKGVTLTRLVG